MAYIQSFNTNRKNNGTADAYGGFTTTANAGVSNTSNVNAETGLLKDTSKAGNEQAGGSGRFTNLQNYLDANKPQAVDLSQNVGSHITEKVNTANTDLTKAATDYKSQVDANTRTLDQGVLSSVLNNPNANANVEDVGKFNKMLSGSYEGPTISSTSAFNNALQSTGEAIQAGQNVKSAGGQVALLKDMSTDRPYTTGGYNLNQLLLQNNDQARGNIIQAGTQAEPLSQNMTNAFNTAQNETAAAQTANINVANQARQSVAAEIANMEGKWAQAAAAKDVANSARSQQLLNKLATLGNQAPQNTQQAALDANTQQHMATDMILSANKYAGEKATEPYKVQAVNGTVSGSAPIDTSAFSDQDLTDMGITRLQMENLLRTRQRVVDMGGQATDLSQWMAPYIRTSTSADVASAADAQRYTALNALIGSAPTQDVSQRALDTAAQKSALFNPNEAYARMTTEMNTIQAQQQAKWAKEQELRAAQMMADAQKAAAKAQMVSSAITVLAIAAIAFFSDKDLKKDITQVSGDEMTKILNDLTGVK